jgi:hypothetical protein
VTSAARKARRPSPPPPSTWPDGRTITIVVGALLGAVVVWWLSHRTTHEPAAAQLPVPAATHVEPHLAAPASVPPPAPSGHSGMGREDALTMYRKANVYPPTSHPLSKDQLDLLEPNKRHEAWRRTDSDEHVSYLFTAERYFVIGDETLTPTLAVKRDGKPIEVTITQGYATVRDPVSHKEPAIPVSFTRQGDHYAATFAPAKLAIRRQAQISLYVEFDFATGKQLGHFDLQYTPATGVPAKFNGTFGDDVVDGSLIVHVGIDVTTAGHYVIDANLFDADDNPVAWSRFKGDLEAGKQHADLSYFGKVLVDASAHGPFHLGQLRGARYVPELDPDVEQMPSYAGTYATQPYPADQFSDAEWDSPDKQRMIRLLSQQRHAPDHASMPTQPAATPESTDPSEPGSGAN